MTRPEWRRRLRKAVAPRVNFILTSAGVRQKGFFTPYNYLPSVDGTGAPYDELREMFSQRRPAFSEFIDDMASHSGRYAAFAEGPIVPDWNTTWLSRLDGAAIYTAISRYRPRQIVEIGSGNSTNFICRALADHAIDASMTCIDPQPRTDIATLPVRFERRVLEISDAGMLSDLDPGDVLFVDSSHIVQQGFDLDIILARVLPRLRPGVIVHFHDIFLPYPYPEDWAVLRFNEQIALVGWLVSSCFDILFASHYVFRDMAAELVEKTRAFPLHTPDNGGSLWLRRM